MEASTARAETRALESRRGRRDRVGDLALYGLTALAAGLAVAILVGIVYKVVDGAWPSIHHFGLSFVWHDVWDPNKDVYGALNLIYGTALTSFVALVVAARSSRCSRRCQAS